MYNRKLKGDIIDPSIDFRGSVANRSKLSVCALPPLQATVREIPNVTQAEAFANQYIEAKRQSEIENAVPVVASQGRQSISLPKKRGENESKIGGGSLFSRLGKRISTFGNIIENFDSKEYQQRSVSLPQYQTHSTHQSSVQTRKTTQALYQPQSDTQPALRPARNTGLVANTRQSFHTQYFHNHYARSETNNRNSSNHNPNSILTNQNDLKQSNLRVQTHVKNHLDSNKSTFFIQADHESDNKLRNDQDDTPVCAKNNQLNLNFSDASSGSLVSRLLESYSNMNIEQDSSNSLEVKSIERSKRSDKDVGESPTTIKRSAIGGISGHESTSIGNDLFSLTHSSDTSGSSEFVSLADTRDQIAPDFIQPLLTTNYNKKLPPVPVKKMDQSILRDYSGSDHNPKIIDSFVPPEVPKHRVLHKSNSQREASDVFYDCDNFSFTSSKHSYGRSSSISSVNKVEKKIQPPEDTAIFTRKSRKMKKDQQPVINSKDKTVSWQYLKNAGIEPFMLSGYQSGSRLKVINP